MKKLAIVVIALSLLVVGIVIADPGITKVNEVQGLRTSTTVIAAGNLNAESSVDWTISTKIPITGIPGEDWMNSSIIPNGESPPPPNARAAIYQTVYTEDTQNSEVGYISYDKDLDVQTGNKVSGQYNVKAVKQVTYLGVDASSVVTNDYLMLDGAGWPGPAELRMICPFAGDAVYPAFCNKVETGSAMNLKVANLNTQLGDRFVMKAADSGIEIFNNVAVGSYATDLPSKGSVSAYIKGSIREGGRLSDFTLDDLANIENNVYGPWARLYETITFSDSSAISGDISTFAKSMSYTSVIDTSGDREPDIIPD
jgi:hypothetical protein